MGRLQKKPKYRATKVESLGAEFDGDYAKVSVASTLKKGGAGEKGEIKVTLEAKGDHALNGQGQAEIEIEAKTANGLAFAAVLKDKEGVESGKSRDFTLSFQLDDKAKAGEVAVEVEVRVIDVVGKDTKARTVQATVPVVVPNS